MDEKESNDCCVCLTEILDTIYEHTSCKNRYCATCFEMMKDAAEDGVIKCACCTCKIEEGHLKITKLDSEKEVTCEYCSSTLIAKDFDSHLGVCEDYKRKIEADTDDFLI